jgi:hypothetical protein
MCYDLPTISRFFRSCALVIATQQTTQLQWKTYRDSSVINAVYTVLFWKGPPGFAEVKTGNTREIEKKTDELHQQYLMTWVRKICTEGPAGAHTYVNEMGKLKEYARDATQSVFREASSINSAVIGETQHAITNLAQIKLGAQVGVALIGVVAGVAFVSAAAAGSAAAGAGTSILGLQAGTTGLGFAVAGTGNAMTHSLIKTWEQGPSAKLVAVSMDAGKAVASEGGGAIAGGVLVRALAGSAKTAQIIKSAEGEIAKYSARLAQEGLRKKAAAKATNIVAQRTAQVTAQQAAQHGFQATAGRAAAVGMFLPVVFAAWDIWDAVSDYRNTMAANR